MTSDARARTDVLPKKRPEADGCVLRILEGPDAGKELPLAAGSATVGTGRECDLRLSDTAVSGKHVTITVTPDGLGVVDLGSTNGTFYLETRVKEVTVFHGAVLTLGRTRLALRSRVIAGDQTSDRTSYGGLKGAAPAMRRLYHMLERLEEVDYPVLIQGETGVGKELVARAIHESSRRAKGPYEVFDCGAVPPNLAESMLFGHERGAFTGATAQRTGVFVRADGGSVFLDEIGELGLDLQPKLLRVLESREVRPVGGNDVHKVDFRPIAATHRDLQLAVEERRFREDLFFRLNVVTLFVPPLRERREDIPTLVQHFLTASGPQSFEVSQRTLELFTSGYDWPGNVRELRNAIARVIALGSLPEQMRAAAGDTAPPTLTVDTDEPLIRAKHRVIEAFEREYLVSQLEKADGNIARAARSSGMDRSHFKRMLRKHGLLGRAPKDDE